MGIFLAVIAVEFAIFLALYRKTLPYKDRTTGARVTFNPQGDSNMADLVLQVGQSSTGTFTPTKADSTPNTTATLNSATWTISDPAVTVVTNADNTVTVLGVSETTAPISGSVLGTGTDSDGVAWSFTETFTITVGGVTPPADRTTGGTVGWSTPV